MYNSNITERFADILEGLAATRGAGRIFIVAPSSRDWNGDLVDLKGVANAVVYDTLTKALAACIANRGDLIVVLEGTYTLTAVETVSVAGVTIMGAPGRARQTTIAGASSAGIDCLSITAADVTIKDLTLVSNSTTSFCASVAGARARFEDCIFTGGSGGDEDFVEVLNAADKCSLVNCLFEQSVAGSTTCVAVNMVATAAGAPDDLLVKGCTFVNVNGMVKDTGSAATAALRLTVQDCTTLGTIPDAYIKLNTVAGVTGIVTGCRFSHATNATAKFGDSALPAGVLWVANMTEAGVSTARPA